MSVKKRIRKKWDGNEPGEAIDEAIDLLNTIKSDLEKEGHEWKPYYGLIGIKIVYDVDE